MGTDALDGLPSRASRSWVVIDAAAGVAWHFLPQCSRQRCCLIMRSAAATFDVAAADLV